MCRARKGPSGDVVQAVEFGGGRLAGNEEKAFTFHVDQLPSDAKTLTFKVLQKYSTGETVSWIEVAADHGAEPAHPVPVLVLDPAPAAGLNQTASPTAEVTVGASSPPTTTAPATGTSTTGSGITGPLTAAAVGGLVLAAGGWAIWRRRRVPGEPS